MTTLRMTRQPGDRPAPPATPGRGFSRVLMIGLCAGVFGLTGCGTETRPDGEAAVTATPLADVRMPPPDTDRIEYEPQTGALRFYDLSDSGRWMVWLPNRESPIPTGPVIRLPEGTDPKETFVFYSRPGGRRSYSVSLKQIQDAREMHASQPR